MKAAFSFEQAENIRIEYAGGSATRRALATRYNVAYATIDRIIERRTYAKRPGPRPVKRHRLSDTLKRQLTNTRTRTLLEQLGIPAKDLAPRSEDFWTWHAMTLESLARAARAAFLRRMASLHPDAGGNHEDAQALNQLWQTLRNRFRRRGIEP